MSANASATPTQLTPRINDVVRERRGISADTAMRLARYFGGDARSWLNLQTAYDLRGVKISNANRIAREVAPSAAYVVALHPRRYGKFAGSAIKRASSLA